LEGNEWIVRWLNPIRLRVTSRLPRGVLVALSALLALPVFALSKGVYGPAEKHELLAPLRKRLFYFAYLSFMSRFSLREQQLQIFDHLSPALAEYISRSAFQRWFEQAGLKQVAISSRNGNSWRGFGVRPLDSTAAADGPAPNEAGIEG
jgi:hypothetical protein